MGLVVGPPVGDEVGVPVGELVGDAVGPPDGEAVGAKVGEDVCLQTAVTVNLSMHASGLNPTDKKPPGYQLAGMTRVTLFLVAVLPSAVAQMSPK